MIHFSAVVSLLAAVAIVPVSALSVSSSSSTLNLLRRAQALDPSSFPTQCQATCTPIIDTLNSCSLPSCVCTTTNGKELLTCVQCLIEVAPLATVIADGQSVLDSFNSECPNITPLSISTGTSIIPITTATPTTIKGATSPSFSASSTTTTTSLIVTVYGGVVTIFTDTSASASATSVLNPLKKSGAVTGAIRSGGWLVGVAVGVVVGAASLGMRVV